MHNLMKRRWLNSNLVMVLVPWMLFCACKSGDTPESAPSPSPAVRLPVVEWDGGGIDQFKPVITQPGTDPDLAMALSYCDCATPAASRMFLSRASNQGVLPQIFVPQIREAIATNPKLSALNNLGILGEFLKKRFAGDEKIAAQVRESLSDKLQASLAQSGGTSVATRVPFQFGLFDMIPTSAVAVDANTQMTRWNLVAGRKEMWSGGKPLDGVDHGLQLLETARMIAEWAYIFGIGSDGKPNGWGGLAEDIATGNTQLAKPTDPSLAPATSGLFFSGVMTISYPNSSLVQMATQVRETWSLQPDRVPLLTLARMWNAAALAFMDFRPDLSVASRTMLQVQNGVLSPGVQKLPLVWLNSMSPLLENRIINKETRTIRNEAYGSEAPATLESLIALARALQNWRTATANPAASGLTPDLVAKLAPVPEKLTQPIQLIVQNVLANYTFIANSPTPKVYIGTSPMAASPKIAAEAIAALAELDQKTLSSADLRQTVFSLYSSHAAEWAKTGGSINDAPTIIAMMHLSRVMAAYNQPTSWSPYLNQLLENAVNSWAVKQ